MSTFCWAWPNTDNVYHISQNFIHIIENKNSAIMLLLKKKVPLSQTQFYREEAVVLKALSRIWMLGAKVEEYFLGASKKVAFRKRAWTWCEDTRLLVVVFLVVTHCFKAPILEVYAWYFDWFDDFLNSPTTVIANWPRARRALVSQLDTTRGACYMSILTLNCHSARENILKVSIHRWAC